ncbi:MAG: LamG-like jellyroll fold domain-containing protein [Candidatus Odinarchaeota archaeon]
MNTRLIYSSCLVLSLLLVNNIILVINTDISSFQNEKIIKNDTTVDQEIEKDLSLNGDAIGAEIGTSTEKNTYFDQQNNEKVTPSSFTSNYHDNKISISSEGRKKLQGTGDTISNEYFVDNDVSDVDFSADIGNHGNFSTQKSFDATYDTLVEDGGITNTHSLDCAGGYMVVGDDGSTDWGSVSGTISFWIKIDSLSAVFRPWGQSGNMEMRRHATITDEIVLDWGGDSTLTTTDLNLQTGKWYFFAVTWNENTDELYFYAGDESISPVEIISSSSWINTLSEAVVSNNFMASRNGLDPVDGHGEDLRFYDEARNLLEIQSDYNKTLSGHENNLEAYYKLNNDFFDSAGNDDGYASGITAFSTDIPFTGFTPYRLDLEIQWISLPYDFMFEELCIYTGQMDSEDILVDIWNGTGWENIISDLNTYSWNNISITSYLSRSTVTVRYRDGDDGVSDDVESNWQIESALIHMWNDFDPPVVEDFGVDDSGTGTGMFWAIITDITGVSNATIKINGNEHQLSHNGTHWVYQPTVTYLAYFLYQIVNASDPLGNFMSVVTDERSYTFDHDIVFPVVNSVSFIEKPVSTNVFTANVSDNWGKIHTVMVNVTSQVRKHAIMRKTDTGYVNDTLVLDRGLFIYEILVNDTEGNSITSGPYLGFTGTNTAPIVENLTLKPVPLFSNSTLMLEYDYYDNEGDLEYQGLGGTRIRWYKNDELQPELNDTHSVGVPYLFKNDVWHATVEPSDFKDYGNMVTSPAVTVQNSPPEVKDIVYFFGHGLGVVSPGDNTREFLLVDEDLTINYSFTDIDMDLDHSIIYWYRDKEAMNDLTHSKTLPASATSAGEVWHFEIVPYDGYIYGLTSISRNFTIQSRPNIIDSGYEAQKTEEGYYHIWVQARDDLNPIEEVKFEITINSLEYNEIWRLTSTNGTVDTFVVDKLKIRDILKDYQGIDYVTLIGTTITVKVTVITIVDEMYSIKRELTFTFTIEDEASPRVVIAGYFLDNVVNPSNVTFYAEIQEYGAGIDAVILYYYFRVASRENAASSNGVAGSWNKKYYQETNYFNSTEMVFNGTHYVITVDFSPREDTEILFRIKVSDLAGNVNDNAYPQSLVPEIIKIFPVFDPWPFIFVIIAIIVIAAVGSFVATKKFSTTELVGLDVDKTIEAAQLVTEDEINSSQDLYTLGIVVSVFDQRDGPTPIFVDPILLKDNFSKLFELSDLSFSAVRFAENFDEELHSTFDFYLVSGIRLTCLSFLYALDRPKARGGAENISLNILVSSSYGEIVIQFMKILSKLVHDIHIMMDKHPSERKAIAKKVIELRKLVTSILLSYERMYGTVEEKIN